MHAARPRGRIGIGLPIDHLANLLVAAVIPGAKRLLRHRHAEPGGPLGLEFREQPGIGVAEEGEPQPAAAVVGRFEPVDAGRRPPLPLVAEVAAEL